MNWKHIQAFSIVRSFLEFKSLLLIFHISLQEMEQTIYLSGYTAFNFLNQVKSKVALS